MLGTLVTVVAVSAFEANHGQAASEVRFLGRVGGTTLYVTEAELVTVLREPGGGRRAIRMGFEGALRPRLEGLGLEAGTISYFLGNDPSCWQREVPRFARVAYRGLWPGVDLVVHALAGELEYDLELQPGAVVDRVLLAFAGVDTTEIGADGDLVLRAGTSLLRHHRPLAWQVRDGQRRPVEVGFRRTLDGRIGFTLGSHDAAASLVIDPVITYSTHAGGSADDSVLGTFADADGNLYLTGDTRSADFPSTGGVQPTPTGLDCAFVTKLDRAGRLVFSTFLGGSLTRIGTAARSSGYDIAIDAAGNLVVAGSTTAVDFPVLNAFQPVHGGNASNDGWVAKVDPTGASLLWSTYLGGEFPDQVMRLAVDSAERVYVTGYTESRDFPVFRAWQPLHGADPQTGDAFVSAFEPDGQSMVYSTYLGGTGVDSGLAITLDGSGAASVAGWTSSGFPMVNPLPCCGGIGQAFVAHLDPGGQVTFSTNLGGGDEFEAAAGIALDPSGDLWVTGYTRSARFPVVDAIQPALRGTEYDAFVSRIRFPPSTLVTSTYLGGSSLDHSLAIGVDATGDVWLAGSTESADFPLVNPLPLAARGSTDAFVVRLGSGGRVLLASSTFGGDMSDGARALALSPRGDVHVAGWTRSRDFPLVAPFDPVKSGDSEGFALKIDVCPVPGGTGGLGNTLLAVRSPPGSVTFRWLDLPDATTYNLYSDTRKDGAFAAPAGSAPAGDPGLAIAEPAGPVVYYRIAPANACGEGSR